MSKTADERYAEVIELLKSISDPQSVGEAFSGAVKIRKYLADNAPSPSCESCGGWGYVETDDSAYDCPEGCKS